MKSRMVSALGIFILLLLITQSRSQAALYNLGAFWRAGSSFEVPVELLDTAVDSTASVAYTFENSRTSLDTSYYDGAVTYSFEIVVINTDPVARSVSLLDASGTTVASISVPANTNNPTRLRTSFTATSGASNYRVQTPATTATYDLTVYAARILIRQVGATKTRLYYPLISDDVTYDNPTETQIDDNAGTNWAITNNYSIRWLKDSGNLATVASGNPWTLEAVIASDSASATASLGLFQSGTTTQVTGANVTTTATTPTLVDVSFADSATNFTGGTAFQIKVKSSSSSDTAYVYKAGIWVALNPISQGEVLYRIGRSATSNSTGVSDLTGQRVLLDTTLFMNPTVYFEDTSKCSATGCATTQFYSAGTSDSGTTGTSLITSNSPGTAFARTRSSSVSITAGNRDLGAYNLSSGTLSLVSEFAVITFQ